MRIDLPFFSCVSLLGLVQIQNFRAVLQRRRGVLPALKTTAPAEFQEGGSSDVFGGNHVKNNVIDGITINTLRLKVVPIVKHRT